VPAATEPTMQAPTREKAAAAHPSPEEIGKKATDQVDKAVSKAADEAGSASQVTPANRAKATAKAQLAAATTDLAQKVAYLKEAVALDPENESYPILLATFEDALGDAAQADAAKEEAAAKKARVKPKPRPRSKPATGTKGRRAAPSAPPPKKAGKPAPTPKSADEPIKFESLD